jgi:cell surface protein SprA
LLKSVSKYIVVGGISIGLLSLMVGTNARESKHFKIPSSKQIMLPAVAVDSPITPVTLPYSFQDQSVGDPLNYPNSGGLMLNNPANITTNVELDPTTGNYNINQTMGNMNYRPPTYMESDEFQNFEFKKQVKKYWKARVHADSKNEQKSAVIPKLNVGGEIFDRIFGGNTVDIRPNGSAELIFAYRRNKTENPALPLRQRKISTFDFNEKIQLNVVGKIGDKLKLTTSYNTEATFDFENQMKLEYTGYEDEIIKKIEAGNVSMPLNGSLITGSQTLFGVKTQLQFGRTTVTGILTQQKGKKNEIEVTGGAQLTKFEVAGDSYEANKHFFLAHYFRDQYNNALSGLPFINSGVFINRIEVWLTNNNNTTTDVRSVVAFSELAEDNDHIPTNQQSFIADLSPNNLPFNDQNSLYNQIKADSVVREINSTIAKLNTISSGQLLQQRNYELVGNARKLQPTEYIFNPRLGYISLSQQLNPDQILSVAYQYTYNGQTYQVGEFSTDGIAAPKALYTKMLKSSMVNTHHPMWDLMMKNIYNLGAYQINSQDFRLDIFYTNAETGTDINYLPVENEGKISNKPLLQVIGMDRLNQQNDQSADGAFDFIDGTTIISNNGRVIFTVVEPFGDYLRNRFNDPSSTLANRFVFDPLYDSTRTAAIQFPNLNRFKMKGAYKSSGGSEISLGSPNVPQGSVTVTAGGVRLTENVDYTVDYTLGRVKIINDGILNSGTPIKVSTESNALFAIQQKTLMGAHVDFKVNKDFTLGGTIMYLKERPLTQKVNIGDEPVANVIWGLDGNYRTDAPFLTRWLDKLPIYSTKDMSTITAAAEYAYLVPGHNKAIGNDGNSYIDDFEGSQSTIDLRTQGAWNLASTPQGQSGLFPEAATDSIIAGYNRAKLAWYIIDPLFLRRTSGLTPDANAPSNFTNTVMSNNFMREIIETEIFPNKQPPNGQPVNVASLDLAYYPTERGQYNYDATGIPGISAGLDANGNLKNPETRWAGITRALQTNDFELANIQYIQFWLMDPFNADNPAANWNSTGDLYFNLGNVSEDVLRDGYKSAENMLPAPSTQSQNLGQNLPVVETAWGRIPTTQVITNAFNNDPNDRPFQDIGLDGLNDNDERTYFSNYMAQVAGVGGNAFNVANGDPSSDNYHHYRGSDYDASGLNTLERYKLFNGVQGNSDLPTGTFPNAATTLPSNEDINRDNNLSQVESYFQYHISLKPSDFAAGVGSNYITNVYATTGQNIKDGTSKPIKWYQFKIPIYTPEARIGAIEGFQSIRFLRMFLKGVDKPIVLRFARLELVRGEWRKYGFDLLSPGLYIPNDDDGTLFDIAAVNIEENGSKQPVNYVLPPNINRQISPSAANLIQLNEQALSLTVCNLADGKARAAFKNTNLDVRSYKRLKMFVHAEASNDAGNPLYNNELEVFIRLGTDFNDNYYEYNIPLKITPPGFYNGGNTDDQYRVWPLANELDLEFEKLLEAKQKRNYSLSSSNISLSSEYTVKDGERTIVVKGNPTLSAIRTIMIGVRNPKKLGPGNDDDGLSKCGSVWVNELRLSDFDQKGGWAANARVTAKLADLGTLSLSGNMYTPGFGTLENRVSERKRETLKQYDISSSLELAKFLPSNFNMHIPMYIGFSETYITPLFNPLDPDIKLGPQIRDENLSKEEKKELKEKTQDYTRRKSINFSNVKKDKGKGSKPHIYDVENWALTYAYSEVFKRNVNIEYNILKNYRGGLNYNFSPQPKSIKPFEKISFLQSKYLALIKDINFSLKPSKLGFNTDFLRDYNEIKNRNITGENLIITPTFNRKMLWNRNYELRYDLTKGIKIDYTATNSARVLELPDATSAGASAEDSVSRKTVISKQLQNFGTNTQFNQQMNINYTIPINKIPLLDFTTASVKYGSTYNWTHSPLYNTEFRPDGSAVVRDTIGNTIQNSKNLQWTGQANMNTLYNKFPFLKKINQKGNKGGKGNAKDTKGQSVNDSLNTKKKKDPVPVTDILGRLIMTVKTINVTYSQTEGTLLNGYAQGSNMLGMDSRLEGPTLGFVFGSQKDIRNKAIEKDWLVKTQSLNTPYTTNRNENLQLRANLEPMPDFKIELNANRTKTRSNSEFFRYVRDTINPNEGTFIGQSPTEMGSYSISYNTFRTSFKDGDAVFNEFLSKRTEYSQKLGDDNPNSNGTVGGYAQGYNPVSQDVLIPAFLASYSGKSSKIGYKGVFAAIPKVNWRATYDGFMKMDFIKKRFKTFNVSHAYKNTYTVGGYTNNLFYTEDKQNNATKLEDISSYLNNPNFLSSYLINAVTISEQWSPLIKIDATLQNSLLMTFEYKRDRNLSLGLTSKTINEIRGNEIVGGLGYRFKNLSLGKNIKIKGKPIKSDLNLRGDLSYRVNETVLRRIVEEVSQFTGGSKIISLKFAADYIINERINIRLFYDWIRNKPVISNSFPTSNINAGLSLRITLSN